MDVEVEKVDVPISIACCEGHHDVGKEPQAMPMACGHKRRKIGGRGRRGMASRKAQIKIGGEIVARRVAPLAVDEAVGRRQQLERVDAEVFEMCLAGRERSDAREIDRCRGPLDERKDVTESAAGDADGALCLNPAPPRWQLVDDETVVGGEGVEPRVVLPVRLVAGGIAGHQLVFRHLTTAAGPRSSSVNGSGSAGARSRQSTVQAVGSVHRMRAGTGVFGFTLVTSNQ